MARQKSRGKHAAQHSDKLVTAESYSRNRYGSQARSGSRSFSAQSRRVGKPGQSTYPDQTMRSSQSNYPADASMRSVKSIYPGNAPKERKNPWRIVFVVSLTVFVAALVGLGAIAFSIFLSSVLMMIWSSTQSFLILKTWPCLTWRWIGMPYEQ